MREQAEFNETMEEQLENLYQAAYQVCRSFLGLEDYHDERIFPWNMEIIGEVTDDIIRTLEIHQYKVCYPSILEDETTERRCCETADCGFQACKCREAKCRLCIHENDSIPDEYSSRWTCTFCENHSEYTPIIK